MDDAITAEIIWQALDEVKDPEIPVISLVELGVVRDVSVKFGRVLVKITPTFSGCPALHAMQQDIIHKLGDLGCINTAVELVLSPPWTSDWISDAGREKLRQFGLAPPPKHGGNLIAVASIDFALCPRCNSSQTSLKNSFGATLCRMLWYCHDCQDAFEQFKPL